MKISTDINYPSSLFPKSFHRSMEDDIKEKEMLESKVYEETNKLSKKKKPMTDLRK